MTRKLKPKATTIINWDWLYLFMFFSFSCPVVLVFLMVVFLQSLTNQSSSSFIHRHLLWLLSLLTTTWSPTTNLAFLIEYISLPFFLLLFAISLSIFSYLATTRIQKKINELKFFMVSPRWLHNHSLFSTISPSPFLLLLLLFRDLLFSVEKRKRMRAGKREEKKKGQAHNQGKRSESRRWRITGKWLGDSLPFIFSFAG